MTYAQAQNILDQRREGQDMPQAVVDKALELTGDLDLSTENLVIDAMREMVQS